jgi:hypothetical protein
MGIRYHDPPIKNGAGGNSMHLTVSAGTPGVEFRRPVTILGHSGRAFTVLLCLGTALTLAGCSYASEALWPSLTGKDPRSGDSSSSTSPTTTNGSTPARSTDSATISSRAASPPPTPSYSATMSESSSTSSAPRAVYTNSTNNVAQAAPPAAATPSVGQTEVGRRATQLNADAQKLDGSVAARQQAVQQIRADAVGTAQTYQQLVGTINARLQVGTTPGNPILQQQWNQANGALDNFGAQIGKMSELSNQVATDASTAAFLLESVRAAYSLSGAVEEDHKALSQVEDKVNREVVTIDRMLNDLSEDISRQSAYMSRERSNMTALSIAIKNGELFGAGLANRAFSPAAPVDGSPTRLGSPNRTSRAENPAASAAGRRPLVVIRFDRPNPSYEQALYTAVSRAIERRPDAVFDLVAVSPGKGNQAQVALASANAKRQAETVLRSLTDMGLPPDRITLSASTSAQTQTNEVQLFVR